MKSLIAFVTAVAASGGLVSSRSYARAQESSRGRDASLPIVEAVGCLSNGVNETWVLTNATAPVVSKAPTTTPSAVKEAGTKPLGTHRYRLVGATPFGPEAHNHHKIVVKGVLVKAPNDDRINVTSLQMVGSTCTRP